MREVKIQVENTQLIELGLKSDITYTRLRFNEDQFIGYWKDSAGDTISFYIGSQCFICNNCQENIDIFESILNKG